MQTEIIIPTWNGRSILQQCLPSVVACARAAVSPARVTVVDDASTDGTLEYLAREFPDVNVIAQPKRQGFPGTINAGAFASTADYLLLLNNDMIPDGPALEHLFEHFADADVAAVSARVVKWDRHSLDVGRRLRSFKNGRISGVGSNEDWPDVSYTFFASGGAAVVDRRKFMELGGFGEIYAPGYVEDSDFGFRCWKRGWKTIWEPRSTFIHMGSATFAPKKGLQRYLGRCRVRYYMRRNSLYFYLKNLTDSKSRRDSLKRIGREAAKAAAKGDVFYFAGLFRALTRLPELKRLNAVERRDAKLGDNEIFDVINMLCRQKEEAVSKVDQEQTDSRAAVFV